MKYKITFTDGDTKVIEAEECRQSGGGLFKKHQWYDFGREVCDSLIDNRDTYFKAKYRVNIDRVVSVEAASE